MAFTINFAQSKKARNSTMKPSVGGPCSCVLKETTSIINPTFQIRLGHNGAPASLKELAKMNYCYCAEFNRYYFITNVQSETAVVVNITCEVDVLATFRDDILATPCFAMYAQSKKNAIIEDRRLPMYGITKSYSSQHPLSICNQSGCFVLTCASPNNDGSNGPAASVVMSEGNLAELSSKLYAEDWFDQIKNDFYHPNEAILSCMWTPLDPGQVATGAYQELKVGSHTLGGGITAKKTLAQNTMLSFELPNADYRAFEPYSIYHAWLPGVGLVEIPMKKIVGEGDLQDSGTIIDLPVRVSAAPNTGDVVYYIMRAKSIGSSIDNSAPILIAKGNFGVEIPVSATIGRFGSVMQSVASGIGSIGLMAGAAAIGNLPLFAMGTSGLVSSAVGGSLSGSQFNTVTSGAVGGWSVEPKFNMAIECTSIGFSVSDNPWEVAPTIGCPLFMHGTIGDFSGFLQCTGAHVKTWATAYEHDIIAKYVNSGGSSGGILVE